MTVPSSFVSSLHLMLASHARKEPSTKVRDQAYRLHDSTLRILSNARPLSYTSPGLRALPSRLIIHLWSSALPVRLRTDPKAMAYRMMLNLSDQLAVQRMRSASAEKEAGKSSAGVVAPELTSTSELTETTSFAWEGPTHPDEEWVGGVGVLGGVAYPTEAMNPPAAEGAEAGLAADEAGAESLDDAGAFARLSRWCCASLAPHGSMPQGSNSRPSVLSAGGSHASSPQERMSSGSSPQVVTV